MNEQDTNQTETRAAFPEGKNGLHNKEMHLQAAVLVGSSMGQIVGPPNM